MADGFDFLSTAGHRSVSPTTKDSYPEWNCADNRRVLISISNAAFEDETVNRRLSFGTNCAPSRMAVPVMAYVFQKSCAKAAQAREEEDWHGTLDDLK